MTTSEPVLADWNTALYGLLHPAQMATVEAHLWIGRPLSPAPSRECSRVGGHPA
jgi:hypothetical protein